MFRRRGRPAEGDQFETAIASIEEKLSAGVPIWRLGREPSGAWAGANGALGLVVRLSAAHGAILVDAVNFHLGVPARAHAEMTLFCAAANRYFSTWNLRVAPAADVERTPSEDVERVVSSARFGAEESGRNVPGELIEDFVWRATRAAVVAAPAVQAVIDGKDAIEAVAIADHFDDIIEWADVIQYGTNGEPQWPTPTSI